MKEFKTFFILLVLALPALLAASAPAPVSSAALGTVDYEVCYKSRGLETKVADASVSLGNGTWDGQSVLHAHAVIRAASIFRLFMNAEYTADAYLAKGGGVEPLYYKNPVKRTGKFECIYDPSAKTVSTERNRKDSIHFKVKSDIVGVRGGNSGSIHDAGNTCKHTTEHIREEDDFRGVQA